MSAKLGAQRHRWRYKTSRMQRPRHLGEVELMRTASLQQLIKPKTLANFDRVAIKQCSDRSSCNMLCSRVVESVVRQPWSAVLTPSKLQPLAHEHERLSEQRQPSSVSFDDPKRHRNPA